MPEMCTNFVPTVRAAGLIYRALKPVALVGPLNKMAALGPLMETLIKVMRNFDILKNSHFVTIAILMMGHDKFNDFLNQNFVCHGVKWAMLRERRIPIEMQRLTTEIVTICKHTVAAFG